MAAKIVFLLGLAGIVEILTGQIERLYVEVIGRTLLVVLYVALAGRPSPKSACIEFLKIKIKCVISPHRGFKKNTG